MEKNPYNPETEPASYKWWNEKPKENKADTKPMWPNIELELFKQGDILNVISYVNNVSGDVRLIKLSLKFANSLSFRDLRSIADQMEFMAINIAKETN